VNFTDLATMLGDFGKSGMTWAQGDFNYDGVVNFDDLAAFLGNYGKAITSSSEIGGAIAAAGITAVPEPGTLALLFAAALGLLAYARRKRK
jgi:hypothetical protein